MNTVCQTCFKPLLPERIEGLKVLEVPEHLWTCLGCAPTDKIKAFYAFESGNSPMIFANKIGHVEHFVQPSEKFNVFDTQPDIEEVINH